MYRASRNAAGDKGSCHIVDAVLIRLRLALPRRRLSRGAIVGNGGCWTRILVFRGCDDGARPPYDAVHLTNYGVGSPFSWRRHVGD